MKDSNRKILIYNWCPFDNPDQIGGGVTIYCKNIIKQIIADRSDITIYFLSSGYRFDASSIDIYYKKIDNIYGNKVHQYEIVNSPVPAPQRLVYRNPLVAIKNVKLKNIFLEFCLKYGNFNAIFFNNIEGISLDILELKQQLQDTQFVYFMHNYIPICLTGTYYMRHKHRICYPNRSERDCYDCSRVEINENIKNIIFSYACSNNIRNNIEEDKWINYHNYSELDVDIPGKYIQSFSKFATLQINKFCDIIFVVSKRVYEIAKSNGISDKKMKISYIGTEVASKQLNKSAYPPQEGLKIVYLGSDINYEEKGYLFFLNALANLEKEYSSKIDLVLTIRQNINDQLHSLLKNFRSVTIFNSYTHDDFPQIFSDVNLSIIPVLWEDNLPQIAIESVAYGIPVLTSSAGGAKELCENTNFIYKSGNIDDLNKKIIFFLNNPKELEKYWDSHKKLTTLTEHISYIFSILNI